jgi:spore maturation protein CgeB
MKIVLLTTYYGPFLRNFYNEFDAATCPSFHEHEEAILSKFFGDTGSTYYHAKQAGHECFLIIANNRTLQQQWALENDISFSEANWEKEIALAQVKKFRPDIFYNEGVFDFFGEFIQACEPYCKRVVAWMSTPFAPTLNLKGVSFVASSTPAFIDQFRAAGLEAGYLLPAFDVRVADKFVQTNNKDIPFSFVGGWSHVHVRRKEAMKELVKRTPVQIWGYGYHKKYPRSSWRYYREAIMPENKAILNRYHGEAWGLDMYEIFHKSLITFNIHESLLQGLVGNMRMFEATGMGTMMLNEDAANLPDMFVPGKEVETYRTIEEAAEKVNYYLAHPEKALEIGRNAAARTRKDYNYTQFVEKLTHYFEVALHK